MPARRSRRYESAQDRVTIVALRAARGPSPGWLRIVFHWEVLVRRAARLRQHPRHANQHGPSDRHVRPCFRQSGTTGADVSRIVYRFGMSNIASGRQIRAARILAGLTQADLARAAGCHPRSVRYWEDKGSNAPTNVASTLDSIEQALNRHGVIPFSTPTPGVRCSS